MGGDLSTEIGPVLGEFIFRQGFRSAHQFAVNAAALASLAGAVLYRLHLHVVPVLPERRENATMMCHIAVPIGGTFPDAHGGEMRRLQRSDGPLVDAVVGNTVESDLAVRPGVNARAFDTIVKVFCLAGRKVVDESR